MSRWQEQIVHHFHDIPEVFAGIDVGKKQLDIFINPPGIYRQITNDAKGISAAIRELNHQKSNQN